MNPTESHPNLEEFRPRPVSLKFRHKTVQPLLNYLRREPDFLNGGANPLSRSKQSIYTKLT